MKRILLFIAILIMLGQSAFSYYYVTTYSPDYRPKNLNIEVGPTTGGYVLGLLTGTYGPNVKGDDAWEFGLRILNKDGQIWTELPYYFKWKMDGWWLNTGINGAVGSGNGAGFGMTFGATFPMDGYALEANLEWDIMESIGGLSTNRGTYLSVTYKTTVIDGLW